MTQNETLEDLMSELSFFENILENFPYPFAIIDIKTYDVVKANQKYLNNSNSQENLKCHKITHHSSTPCSGENHKCPIHEIITTKKPINLKHFHYDVNGNIRYVEIDASPILDSSGNIRFITEFSRDITEKLNLEKKLKLLSIAVEGSPESILITDANGKIEYINEKFTQTYGYNSQEVIGKSPNFLKSGKTPKNTYKSLWKTITSGHIWKGEFINLNKDGQEIIEECSISPLIDENGKIINYVAIKEDITQRKKLELEIIHHANHDALTGLANRRELYKIMNLEFNTRRHNDKQNSNNYALFYLDLDGFKDVNDKHSHDVGDDVLIETAHRLKKIVRSNDLVSRLGGDEFAIFINGFQNIENLELIGQKILNEISTPYLIKNLPIRIGTSIGIAVYDKNNLAETAETIIHKADEAMYIAKEKGKNNCVIFK